MKNLALLICLALAGGAQAAPAAGEAPAPAAPATPAAAAPSSPAEAVTAAEAAAPVAPAVDAPAGEVTAPTGPAALSPSAGAATGDDMPVPEEVEDPMQMASEAPITDLKPVSSTVLAKMANGLGNDTNEVYYDPASGETLKESAAGAWRVDTTALYAELAHRLAYDEDKDARQALNLADLRKDERAKEARELAFEDKLADATIAQVEAGKAKAKADLEALAGRGNRRARQYLGLDKLPAALAEPALKAGTPTAGVEAVSPSAGVGAPGPVTPPANVARP